MPHTQTFQARDTEQGPWCRVVSEGHDVATTISGKGTTKPSKAHLTLSLDDSATVEDKVAILQLLTEARRWVEKTLPPVDYNAKVNEIAQRILAATPRCKCGALVTHEQGPSWLCEECLDPGLPSRCMWDHDWLIERASAQEKVLKEVMTGA